MLAEETAMRDHDQGARREGGQGRKRRIYLPLQSVGSRLMHAELGCSQGAPGDAETSVVQTPERTLRFSRVSDGKSQSNVLYLQPGRMRQEISFWHLQDIP